MELKIRETDMGHENIDWQAEDSLPFLCTLVH